VVVVAAEAVRLPLRVPVVEEEAAGRPLPQVQAAVVAAVLWLQAPGPGPAGRRPQRPAQLAPGWQLRRVAVAVAATMRRWPAGMEAATAWRWP